MRPLPYSALRKFVKTEGWTKSGTVKGKNKTGDHFRYTLALADGDILYTRISHGSGQFDDPNVVAAIFRNELKVSEEDFWACVDHGVLPPRPGTPESGPEGVVLDAKLVRNLIRRVGLTEDEVAQLSKTQAIEAWQEYLARGGT